MVEQKQEGPAVRERAELGAQVPCWGGGEECQDWGEENVWVCELSEPMWNVGESQRQQRLRPQDVVQGDHSWRGS